MHLHLHRLPTFHFIFVSFSQIKVDFLMMLNDQICMQKSKQLIFFYLFFMQHLPAVSNIRNIWIFVCIQEFLSHTVGGKNYNKKFLPKGLPATDIYAYKVAYCSYAPLWRHDNWTELYPWVNSYKLIIVGTLHLE